MTPKALSATATIGAPPATVWGLVTDVTRMGEWSPECRACEWTGVTGPVVGAEFVGHNVAGPIKWSTTCRIERAEPPAVFGFVVVDHGRTSSRWQYRFEPAGDGSTMLTETFEFVWCPWYSRAVELFLPRTRQLRSGMEATLRRLALAAEGTTR